MQPAQKVSIGCTMLVGKNKKGVLTPDQDGYYTTVIGAYGGQNSAGYQYDLQTGRAMFQPGSVLMRKLEKGVLYAEYKHPKREPHMTDNQYVARIREVDDDRRCAHIAEVWLLPNQRDENGNIVDLVLAKVRPCGPFGDIVRQSFENPRENTYFSVRSITMDDIARGIKYTKEIVTWDYVGEGGIYMANKYSSPALECYSLESFTETEVELTPTMLWQMQAEQSRAKNLGLENSADSLDELINVLGWQRSSVQAQVPAFMRW